MEGNKLLRKNINVGKNEENTSLYQVCRRIMKIKGTLKNKTMKTKGILKNKIASTDIII